MTPAEITLLTKLKNAPMVLNVDQCQNSTYKADVDLAEAMENKGLCDTTFSISNGFKATITKKGIRSLQALESNF